MLLVWAHRLIYCLIAAHNESSCTFFLMRRRAVCFCSDLFGGPSRQLYIDYDKVCMASSPSCASFTMVNSIRYELLVGYANDVMIFTEGRNQFSDLVTR